MGWWSQNEKGESFEGDGALVWGDSCADAMDDALSKITAEFESEQGRKPTKEELAAGFRFSLRGHPHETLYHVIELEPHMTLEMIDSIVEKARERAFPTLISEKGLPVRIEIAWEEGGAADDPWELREAVEELETNIGHYFESGHFTLGRPKPKATA